MPVAMPITMSVAMPITMSIAVPEAVSIAMPEAMSHPFLSFALRKDLGTVGVIIVEQCRVYSIYYKVL